MEFSFTVLWLVVENHKIKICKLDGYLLKQTVKFYYCEVLLSTVVYAHAHTYTQQ